MRANPQETLWLILGQGQCEIGHREARDPEFSVSVIGFLSAAVDAVDSPQRILMSLRLNGSEWLNIIGNPTTMNKNYQKV